MHVYPIAHMISWDYEQLGQTKCNHKQNETYQNLPRPTTPKNDQYACVGNVSTAEYGQQDYIKVSKIKKPIHQYFLVPCLWLRFLFVY